MTLKIKRKKKKSITYAAIIILTALLCGCKEVDNVAVNADILDYSITREETQEIVAPDESNVTEAETYEPNDITETTTEPPPPEIVDGGGIESITLSTYSVTLNIGKSRMPIVTMKPDTSPDKSEIWTSSDESVAVVDNIGNIKGVSAGECVVTVISAVSPSVFAEVSVLVLPESELTYIQNILIANKTYALPRDYNPGVNQDASVAFEKMQEAAAVDGLNIYISSGYRSYDYQDNLYNNYVNSYGKEQADRFSARAGYSEHQTGLAFDVNTIDSSFTGTPEAEWVAAHCYEYGFIIRYPEGKESITGYQYEPWHIRYLGTETATAVFESGLTLEEYLGITSVYAED